MNKVNESFHIYGIIVWIIAILFYFYEFFLRVMPATISTNIIIDLNISLSQFAMISSAYYITYSAMQIPVGILIDRFGVRLLASVACIFCTVGVVSFSYSSNFYSVIASRLLIGFGSSFGFVSLLVLAFNWFPHRHFGFLGGLGQALGAIGPILAGAPVVYMMKLTHDDWRLIFIWISVFGLCLSCIMALFLRNKPDHPVDEIIIIEKKRNLKQDLLALIKMKDIWVTMVYTGFVYVSLPMLGAYWGVLYLETRGFTKLTCSFMVSMIWIGLAIGSPLFGRISDRIKRRKPILASLGFAGALFSLLFIFYPTGNEWLISAFLLLIGMSAGGQSLAFAMITEYVPAELKATALGANNTAVMSFAAILPPLATLVIEWHLGSKLAVREDDMIAGFLLMPIAFILSGLISIFAMKETYCRRQDAMHQIE